MGVITHAFWARAIGPEQYGILGFTATIVSYFGLAAALGTDIWGTRSVARNTVGVTARVSEVVSLRLILSVLSFLVFVVLLAIWRPPLQVVTVIMIQFAGVLIAAFTLDFAFQGLENMGSIAKRQIVTALLALVGISLTFVLEPSVVMAAAIFQGAALVGALLMLSEFIRLGSAPKIRINLPAFCKVLRASAPMAVTGMVTAVYFSIDIVMLGFLRSQVEVGLYVAAGKFYLVGMTAATILRSVYFPVLSRLLNNGPARREASGHFVEVIIFFGTLIALGGFLLASENLEIVFGTNYVRADNALRILMVNLFLAHIVAVYHVQLLAWGLQKQQMQIVVAGAAFNVAMNLWLIPKFGMVAAAATTLASSLVVFALALFILKRRAFEVHFTLILKAAVLGIILAFTGERLLAVAPLPENVILRFLVAGTAITALYAGLAFAIRLIRPKASYRYMRQSPAGRSASASY